LMKNDMYLLLMVFLSRINQIITIFLWYDSSIGFQSQDLSLFHNTILILQNTTFKYKNHFIKCIAHLSFIIFHTKLAKFSKTLLLPPSGSFTQSKVFHTSYNSSFNHNYLRSIHNFLLTIHFFTSDCTNLHTTANLREEC